MKRARRGGRCLIGMAAILLGSVILCAMLLPSGFWWGVVSILLIAGGILFVMKCR